MSGTANGAARAPERIAGASTSTPKQHPRQNVAADARARLAVYRSDWSLTKPKLLLAASANVFVASALPAVAFGVQLAAATNNVLTPAHTLLATAIASVVQALIGGQPLLVVGVAEPIVIIWAFLAAFCRSHNLPYLAFCGWTCAFAAVFLSVAAFASLANRTVSRFTRFSCETFGTVISVLFAAVGVKVLIGEFGVPDGEGQLPLINGLWALIVASGTALTALLLVGRARLWKFGWPWLRALLSDYGALISVVVWTAVSFALRGGGSSVPHRVPPYALSGLAQSAANAAPQMMPSLDLPGWAIAAALIPALVVTALFWLDHTVSSRMAHDAGGHPLAKPTAYDWDLLLCGLMTLLFGLVGLPPTNGVIPQTPILSRSLLIRPHKKPQQPLAVVLESRWPNLLQGLAMAVCLVLVPSVLPLVPFSVVAGFFLFLAVEPLRNMQLWRDQVWMLLTDKKTRARVVVVGAGGLAGAPRAHGLFASSHRIPLASIALITVLQLVWAIGVALLALLAGIAGVSFPLPLVLLVPLRSAVLPWVFGGLACGRRRLGGLAALEAIDPIADPDALLVLEDEVVLDDDDAAELEEDDGEEERA